MNTNGDALTRLTAALIAIGMVLTVPERAAAQCTATLESRILAYSQLSRSLVDSISTGSANQGGPEGTSSANGEPRFSRETIDMRLANPVHYLSSVQDPAAAGCVVLHGELFRRTVVSSLWRGTVTRSELEEALARGAAAVIRLDSERGRVGIVFGFGFSRVQWGAEHAREFKLVDEPGESGITQRYIVRAGESRAFPLVTTGIVAPIRRRSACDGIGCLGELLMPTGVFGTLQLSPGGTDRAVSTALGFSWQVVGDINVLFGYTSMRYEPLQEELDRQLTAAESGRIPIPSTMTRDQLTAKETGHGFVWALTVPVALGGSFGRPPSGG